MNYIRQFSIILMIGFIGEVLNALIPLPIPGCIYGMVLLFLLLLTKIIRLDQVRAAGRYLVDIQPVMFVAPAVGMIGIWDQIKNRALQYLVASVICMFLSMAVSGIVTQFVIRRTKKGGKA